MNGKVITRKDHRKVVGTSTKLIQKSFRRSKPKEREYRSNRCRNMFEEDKQILKEYE